MPLTRRAWRSNHESSHPSLVFLLYTLAAGFLGGCSLVRPHDDPTRFYVLTVPSVEPIPVAHGEFRQLRIGLKPVEMPAYLQTRSMVVRTGANEIHFAEFDRWAEPLTEGIGRVMKEMLISADNVSGVTINSRGDEPLDCVVAIRILSCEGVRGANGTSSIRFAAIWELGPMGTNSTALKNGRFSTASGAWDGTTYAQLANRLSEALARAGSALAADLPKEAFRALEATPGAHR